MIDRERFLQEMHELDDDELRDEYAVARQGVRQFGDPDAEEKLAIVRDMLAARRDADGRAD